MKKILFKIAIFTLSYFSLNFGFSQNAGVTSLGNFSATPGTILVPLDISNSPDIGYLNLKFKYNGSVLSYIGLQDMDTALLNHAVLFYGNEFSAGGLKNLYFYWGTDDNDVHTIGTNGSGLICNIKFHYYGGQTCLIFDNTLNHGGYCEYNDENGNPFNDNPTLNYYTNGQVGTTEPCDSIDVNCWNGWHIGIGAGGFKFQLLNHLVKKPHLF